MMHGSADAQEISSFYDPSPTKNVTNVLKDSDEIFPYVYQMIQNAEKSIHIEMYLFEGDIGRRIRDLLARKAAEGVDVRILYHPPGSIKLYNRAMALLKHLGLKRRAIQYETFEPAGDENHGIRTRPYPLHRFARRTTLRMAHNKVLIVDGAEAMIGGANFASITEPNHDVMVTARGPVVHEMEKVFAVTWQLAGGLEEKACFVDGPVPVLEESEEPSLVSYRITHPYLENTKSLLLDLMRQANSRVLVEMYLFIDPDLAVAIIEAHGRSLDVRVLFDAKPLPLDMDFHGFPNKRVIHKLVRAGVPTRVYRSDPGQEMHMKLALFDDDSIVVGSTNWTTGSFSSNSESCFHIQGNSVYEKFRDIFEYDWAHKSIPAAELTRTERVVSSMISIIDWIY